jgi:ABC-type glycerol-3-phosphate transport system substrate-binding protein
LSRDAAGCSLLEHTVQRSVILAHLVVVFTAGCGPPPSRPALTFAGSAVGREAEVIHRQLARFHADHPEIAVEVRATPDAADARHQLYVQWLNAHATDPDVLQLDVVWTPEFAAAGWVLPLDRFRPPTDDFFAAAISANRWRGPLYALPWFMDVGMLYWRTDLASGPPADFETLDAQAARRLLPFGFVWQGARYEGLVTVFLEYLGAFGGRILDDDGHVVVDADPAVRALQYMRDQIHVSRVVPMDVLAWQEEQTRFAFQNAQAEFMRNWPYAVALLRDSSQSKVAGRFAVAPMPAGPGGSSTAALGGSQLAINAMSDHPEAAYTLIEFLLEPAQMLERARLVGQYPSRPALYDNEELAEALGVPAADARRIIERAVPRPVTPVYSELSDILQVHLHRALTQQEEPRAALVAAAATMRTLLERSGLEAEPAP